MPWAMTRLLAGCCMLAWCLQGAAAEAMEPTMLRDDAASLDAQPLARTFSDPRGDTALAQVVRSADQLFAPVRPGALSLIHI